MEELEHHYINAGVLITEHQQVQGVELCTCQVHHLFKTRHYTQQKIGPLLCFYLIKIRQGTPPNRLISKALGKDVYGPVLVRYPDQDADPRQVLDYLLGL